MVKKATDTLKKYKEHLHEAERDPQGLICTLVYYCAMTWTSNLQCWSQLNMLYDQIRNNSCRGVDVDLVTSK